MARTSKGTKSPTRPAGTGQSPMSSVPTGGRPWTPAEGPSVAPRATVGARPGGLGIGSPIYEELVAELGDPAA